MTGWAAPSALGAQLRGADWPGMAKAFLIGGIGGAIFDHFAMPLAWLLGAMVATTAAATAGVRIAVPRWMNSVCFAILGVLMGAGFTPAVFDNILSWWATLALMLCYVLVVGATIALFFQRFLGYDRPTAYFAAMPGGIAEMTAFAMTFGADVKTVTLIHGTRILLVTLAVPIGLRFIAGYEPQGVRAMGDGLFLISAYDALILTGCGVLGYFAARSLRIPAPFMIGALILSGAAHAGGLTDGRPPGALIGVAQLAIGAAIGVQFVGANPRVILRTIAVGLATVSFMLAAATGLAAAIAARTDHALTALILAYAPAGITEMSVVALALGLDVVFVAGHHLIRITFLILFASTFLQFMPDTKR